jgi:glucose-1-phosphate cytidylyltransferase
LASPAPFDSRLKNGRVRPIFSGMSPRGASNGCPKVGILAGGLGTRLAEYTDERPKPMVEVGGRPLLWHIMKTYAAHGFEEFAIALGYRGHVISDYFMQYHNHRARSITIDLGTDQRFVRNGTTENWVVHLVDTGEASMTGGRVRRLAEFAGDTFMLTYGDAVANVDLTALLEFHRAHGKLATVTAVRPPARFGALELDGDRVEGFAEKPQVGEGWINGGYFVLEPEVADYIAGDSTVFELEPLERLTREGQLMAFKHDGFWQCMDTIRERRQLEELWTNGAPWRVWA